MSNALQMIEQTIMSVEADFKQRSVDESINFERESVFALQQLTQSDYAIGIAMSNKQSVINAVSNVSAIGLSLSPAKRQAYLVPRDKKICLDISYMGLIDLATATGSIKWAQAAIVREADTFSLNGIDRQPTHQYNPFATDRGEIVGCYAVVKTADGDYLSHAVPIKAIYDIRDRSSAYRAYLAKKVTCPWVTDEIEMIRKTVIKQAYKYWPKVDRLEKAIHLLNTDSDEGLAELVNEPTIIEQRDQAPAPATQNQPMLNQKDIDEIEALAQEVDCPISKITAAYKVSALSFIPKLAYESIIKNLEAKREKVAA